MKISHFEGGIAYDATTRRLLNVKDALNRETDYSYYHAGRAIAGRVKARAMPGGNWTYFDHYPE